MSEKKGFYGILYKKGDEIRYIYSSAGTFGV